MQRACQTQVIESKGFNHPPIAPRWLTTIKLRSLLVRLWLENALYSPTGILSHDCYGV